MTDLASQRRRSLMDAIRVATDDAERARLLDELDRQVIHDIEAPVNDTQIRVWNFELQMREVLRAELGSTNAMIGDLNAVTIALRDMFQSWAEELTGLRADVTGLQRTVGHHSDDITSLKRARDLLFEGRDRNYAAIEQVARKLDALYDRVTKYDALLPPGMDQDVLIRRLIALLTQDHDE